MVRAGSLFTLWVSYVLVAPVGAIDLLVPVSQDRSVVVSALANDTNLPASDQDADSLGAGDWGLLDVSTGANASIPTADASSTGAQTSRVLSASIETAGSMSASADAHDYTAFGDSDGLSHCEVTFDVTGPASFTLSGSLTAFASGTASVTLDGPGGTIVSIAETGNQTTPVLETDVLDPATYTLVARASGSAHADFFIFFSASASYDLVLSLTPATGVPGYESSDRGALLATPNPFRQATVISHDARGRTDGVLAIFDVRGRLVREFPASDTRGTLSWDGRNRFGAPVAPGVYLVRLSGAPEAEQLKVTRLR